jgi:hypothetical protein
MTCAALEPPIHQLAGEPVVTSAIAAELATYIDK